MFPLLISWNKGVAILNCSWAPFYFLFFLLLFFVSNRCVFKGLFICGVLRFVAGWRTFVLFSYICLYCSVLLEFFTSQISVLCTFLFLLILHFMSKISVYVFFTRCIMVYKRVPTFVLFSYILVSLRFVGIFSFSNFCCTHLFYFSWYCFSWARPMFMCSSCGVPRCTRDE